jgi:hypothetical protein
VCADQGLGELHEHDGVVGKLPLGLVDVGVVVEP